MSCPFSIDFSSSLRRQAHPQRSNGVRNTHLGGRVDALPARFAQRHAIARQHIAYPFAEGGGAVGSCNMLCGKS